MHLAKSITFATGPLKLVWECDGQPHHTVVVDGEDAEATAPQADGGPRSEDN